MSSGLKILQVLVPALHPNKGGVQMTTCKLGRYFASRGQQAFSFSFANSGHSHPECINLRAANESGGVANTANLIQLGSFIDEIAPDIVINHMPYEHAISTEISKKKDYLLIACLRNTLFSVKGDLDSYIEKILPTFIGTMIRNRVGKNILLQHHRKRHRRDLEIILSNYDQFVMFGPPNLKELEYFVPKFDRSKIALIPNSIPSVKDCVPVKQKRLLWLGRVSKSQKRADLIPGVWAGICDQRKDWQLDIVGNGPDLDWLKHEIDRRNLPRVNFFGRQKPDGFYSRSALFFMTSSFEGFPNTLIEAQSHGCIPIVFDSYPVIDWLIEHGSNGFLIEPFDTASMVEEILQLTESLQQDMVAQNCLASARRFHIEQVGEMWDSLFKKHLGSHQTQIPT